jgi:hypothetical protein
MPLQKICNQCKQGKPVANFYANKRMKDGLNTFCIVCHKADNVARKAVNRAKPDFKALEAVCKKEYRERTVEQRAVYMLDWRGNNTKHVAQYGKKYRNLNKARYAFLCQKRKIDLLQRTPKWLTQDDFWVMREAYELAALRTKMFGFSWHVDHDIPLRGKRVSGLHTPNNLRVVPATVNQAKTNKFEV